MTSDPPTIDAGFTPQAPAGGGFGGFTVGGAVAGASQQSAELAQLLPVEE